MNFVGSIEANTFASSPSSCTHCPFSILNPSVSFIESINFIIIIVAGRAVICFALLCRIIYRRTISYVVCTVHTQAQRYNTHTCGMPPLWTQHNAAVDRVVLYCACKPYVLYKYIYFLI